MPSAPGWAGSLHRVSTGGCAVCGLRTPRGPLGGSDALAVEGPLLCRWAWFVVLGVGARRVCKQVSARGELKRLRCQLLFVVAAAPFHCDAMGAGLWAPFALGQTWRAVRRRGGGAFGREQGVLRAAGHR